MTTKYKIAEQARRVIEVGNSGPNEPVNMQELILAVSQAFGVVVKANWFQNKNEGLSEIDGTFIYPFKNIPILYDKDLTQYYSVLPSSYISLPHELGIQQVSLMKSGSASQSQAEPMVRVFNGFTSLSRGLALENLQTRKAFYVEGSNIIYLGMTEQLAQLNVLIKLAVALEEVDEDQQVNIAPELQSQIIDMVVQKYLVEKQIPDNKVANKL